MIGVKIEIADTAHGEIRVWAVMIMMLSVVSV